MPARWIGVFALLLFLGGSAHSNPVDEFVFPQAWRLTEDEAGQKDWQEYKETAVPFGFNRIIWLKQTLPVIEDKEKGLFFAPGLEDLEIYIDGSLVYRYGEISKDWSHGRAQAWHYIPLTPKDSGKELRIRTHYMISYLTRTLYPTIQVGTEIYARQWRHSLYFTFASGAFIVLAILCLTIAFQRRLLDVFFHFGIMTLCAGIWTTFNQDSLIKQFMGIPESSWVLLDLAGLYVSAAGLFTFFSDVLKHASPVIRFASRGIWFVAVLALFCASFGLLHPWYLIPVLHLFAIPAFIAIVPGMIRAAFHHNKEARFLILGSVAVSISGIHDAARYVIHSPIEQMIPIGVILMFGSMVAVLARRYREEQSQTIATQAKLLDDIQHLNARLQDHVHKVEAIVEEKTMEIRSILGHIQQGIFMVESKELLLNREHSAYLEQLLGETQIGGQFFRTVFLDKCQLGADQKQTLLSILELILGENEAGFDLNVANLPHEVNLQAAGVTRVLELSWAPILDEDGIIQKILVTARDVTRLRELQKAAEQSQEEMHLVQIILAKKPERMARFLNSSRALLEQTEASATMIATASAAELRTVLRHLHTLKGNARSFDLSHLAELAHEAEQTILSSNWNALNQLLGSIRELIGQYMDVLQQRVGWTREADQIMIDRGKLEHYFLQDLPRSELENFLLPHTFVSAQQLVKDVFTGMQRIAEDLGKDKPTLKLEAEGYFFPRMTEDILSHSLGHLFRNALDHGLENASERVAMGKSAFGCIAVSMQSRQDYLHIRCSDDGRGLDIGSIRSRALASGLLKDNETLSETHIEKFIFSSGFSTKKTISIISGRGVGLDAARSFLRSLQGDLRLIVDAKDNEQQLWSCAFELILPPGTWLERRHKLLTERAS